jgi:hypothetical protein
LGAGFFEPAAMDHADADPRLADIDVAHLLVDQPFRDRLLRIALKLGRRNMGARTHGAGRLRIGRIDADGFLGDDRRADRKAEGRKAQKHSLHYVLLFLRGMAPRQDFQPVTDSVSAR